MIGGAVLLFALFISHYSSSPAALWIILLMGVVLAVPGYVKNYEWAAVNSAVVKQAPVETKKV
jgi:hypothetical protein